MHQLTDAYGRIHNYLRLSITDRCNFRCYYCMPEEGVQFEHQQHLLSLEELYKLVNIFCSLGINKIRITGGEPFVRPGIIDFLKKIKAIHAIKNISITSNGTISSKDIDALWHMGINSINISLDSLDRHRFFSITRRDKFNEVYETIQQLLHKGFDLKLNCVVSDVNTEDIIPFVELTRNNKLSVRFLEEMPFNGSRQFIKGWTYIEILQHIQQAFPDITKLSDEQHSTSLNYAIPHFKGSVGIIPSYSRTFCGTCNRIRLSATGEIRTCLYGQPSANLRDLLRSGMAETELVDAILHAIANKARDGFETEQQSLAAIHPSMSALGG